MKPGSLSNLEAYARDGRVPFTVPTVEQLTAIWYRNLTQSLRTFARCWEWKLRFIIGAGGQRGTTPEYGKMAIDGLIAPVNDWTQTR